MKTLNKLLRKAKGYIKVFFLTLVSLLIVFPIVAVLTFVVSIVMYWWNSAIVWYDTLVDFINVAKEI